MNTQTISESDLYNVQSNKTNGDTLSADEWNVLSDAMCTSHERINSLVGDLSEIISLNATASLSVSPSAIFVATPTNITVTATTNTNAENITIKQGSTVIKTGNGKTLAQSVTVNQATAGNVSYTAEFTFAGGNKRTATATVYFVNKVYIGAGNNVEDVAVDDNAVSARRSINTNGNNGTLYTVTVTDDNPYVFFIMPASFDNIDHATMNGFAYNLTPVTTTVIEGVNYKYYRCDVPMDPGTYNILIY